MDQTTIQYVLEFMREAGMLPSFMLVVVLLQLKAMRSQLAALPCRKSSPPAAPAKGCPRDGAAEDRNAA